jgi:hypothetical protein
LSWPRSGVSVETTAAARMSPIANQVFMAKS